MQKRSTKGTRWTAQWDDERQRWKLNAQVKGVRRSFYSSVPGRAGATECQQKAMQWVNMAMPNEQAPVKDICKAYIESLKGQRSPSSAHWRKHDSICTNWIIPHIGNRKIGSIQDIEILQKILYAAFDAGLCKRSIANIRTTIVGVFKYARIKKATTFTPEGLAVPRYAPTKGRPALDVDDMKKLLTEDYTLWKGRVIKEIYVNAWRFGMLMGLRPGEIIGLKHSDIQDGVVYINGAINTGGEATKGKNKNAIRHASIIPLAQWALQKQKELLEELDVQSEYVFPDYGGDHIRYSTWRNHWDKYCEYHKMRKGITPYSLRNTCVSVMKDIPKARLDPVIGHSEDMDTFGTYGREITGDLDIVSREMEAAYDKVLGDEFTKNIHIKSQ